MTIRYCHFGQQKKCSYVERACCRKQLGGLKESKRPFIVIVSLTLSYWGEGGGYAPLYVFPLLF